MRTYVWNEYRIQMIAICLMVAVGTCQLTQNYGILTGEVRDRRHTYLGGF